MRISLGDLPDIVWSEASAPSQDALSIGFPSEIVDVLNSLNGAIALGGTLHFRGNRSPETWNDVGEVWRGPHSLAKRYPTVTQADVPFAENCLADQFLWREGAIVQLLAESGEIEAVDETLSSFLRRCAGRDPKIWLGARYLKQFESGGGRLEPDQALFIYPPLTLAESAQGVSLKPVSRLAAIDYWSDFARSITGLADGTEITITTQK